MTTKSEDSELVSITEGLVHWATMFYQEELENEAKQTGIPFTPIVHPKTKTIPLRKAEQTLILWRDKHALRERIAELQSIKSEKCICNESGVQACDSLWHHDNNIDDRIVELEALLKALEGEKDG